MNIWNFYEWLVKMQMKLAKLNPANVIVAIVTGASVTCAMVAVVSGRHDKAQMEVAVPSSSVSATASAKGAAPTVVRVEDLPSENGAPDTVSARPSPTTSSKTKYGRIKTATHLFDSKKSARAAAGAVARSGPAGYLHEASLHGVPVEAGERVVLLDRSFTGEYVEVRSLDSGRWGWTLSSIVAPE